MKDIKALCDQVRQISYDIHVYHAHGHWEKVYENALAHRLRKAGLEVKQQHPIKVHDEDGTHSRGGRKSGIEHRSGANSVSPSL